MTGDLAVTHSPAVVDRASSRRAAPVAPTRASAGGAPIEPAVADPRAAARLRPSETADREVSRLRALLADPKMRISTHHDQGSDRVVLRVLDRATGEVVDQYPPDTLLRLFAALRQAHGALVDQRA